MPGGSSPADVSTPVTLLEVARHNARFYPGLHFEAGLPVSPSKDVSGHTINEISHPESSLNRGPGHIPLKELYMKTFGEKEGLAIWESSGAERGAAL